MNERILFVIALGTLFLTATVGQQAICLNWAESFFCWGRKP